LRVGKGQKEKRKRIFMTIKKDRKGHFWLSVIVASGLAIKWQIKICF
jgi:hypothetical protein